MNKSDLIEVVSTKLGDRRTASAAVEAVVDAITRAVARGEKVGISGFGVFERVERAARTARNPTTGEAVPLDRTTVPKFRPGQGFKDIVSGAKEVSPESGPRAVTARAGIPRKVADAVAAALPSAAASDGDEAAPARTGRSAPAKARAATRPAAAPAQTATAAAPTAAKAAKAAPARAGKTATTAPAKAAPSPASGGVSARSAVRAPAGSAATKAGGGRTVAAPGAVRSAAAAKAPGRSAAAKAAGAPAAPAKAPAKRTRRS